MDSIKDAFLKVGLQKNNKKNKIIIPKLDKEEYKVFNQMHQDPKRRKFLLHLIHAFLPNIEENNVDFIWNWNNIKGERRCVMCEQNIISLADAYIKVNNNIDDNFKIDKIMINNNNISVFSETNIKIDNILSSIFQNNYFNAFNNKIAGIHSNKSKVFMCAPCYKLFNNWIANMFLRRHKDFKYVIGNRIKF